jgi:hypothetical protein
MGTDKTQDIDASGLNRASARASYFESPTDFRMSSPEWGPETLHIENISVTGAKLRRNQAGLYFRPGEEYEVLLHLKDHFESWVQIRIIYVKSESIGVQFTSPSLRFQHLIRVYFKTELAGAKLQRELANEQLARWVSEEDGDEVEAGFENGQLMFLSVSLDSLAYRFKWVSGSNATAEKSDILVRVIRNIPNISDEHKQAIESIISSSSAQVG